MAILRGIGKRIKEWLRDRVPYFLLLRVYYVIHERRYRRLFEEARRRAGFSSLETLDLSTVKRSDTLFILGSGASINRISAEAWRVIGEHDSVGFNFWLFHPFVPTMYFVEGGRPGPYDHRILQAIAARASDYRDVVKVITDIAAEGHQYIFDLDPGFRPKLYVAETVPLVARSESELRRGISFLKRSGTFDRSDRIASLFKHTGTLSTMIVLGAKLGYRRLVLCGVDLTAAASFYQDPVLFPASADLVTSPPNQKHLTLTRHSWGTMPVDAVVRELKAQILDPAGIELLVENPHSALASFLPVADAECFVRLASPKGTAV